MDSKDKKSKRAGYIRAIIAGKAGMPQLDLGKIKKPSANLQKTASQRKLDRKKIDLDTTTFDRFDEIIERRTEGRKAKPKRTPAQEVFGTEYLRRLIGAFASKTKEEQAMSLASSMSLLYITFNVFDFLNERENKKELGDFYMKEMKDFEKKVNAAYLKTKDQFGEKSEDSGDYINDLEDRIIDYYDDGEWEQSITRLSGIPIEKSRRDGYKVDVEPFATEIQQEIDFRYEMYEEDDDDDDFDEDAIYDEKMDEIKDRIKNRMEKTKKLVNKKIKDINIILSLPTDKIEEIAKLSVDYVGE